MYRLTALVLAVLISGCSTAQPPAERPYTDAEIKQFALEVLSRSSLSYEDYEKIRRALSEPSHRLSTRLEDVPSTTREPRS